MLLKQRHNTVTSNGNIGKSKSFSIARNAKMFRVLSDTMYEDKIGSVVRELCCNAIDAHRAAGRVDVPFTIHLPNALEPWFSVRDTGTGMRHRAVMDLYSTYGESTKDHTNDDIGAFGLGSKTPFSYTDQFTVTSIYNGRKRVYVAVIGDDGLPDIALKDVQPCSDHAGLEVTLAVANEDFHTFNQAIIKQLMFFTVKPTLENNMKQIEFIDPWKSDRITFFNDDVTLYNSRYNNPVDGLWIVQGGVGYPLDCGKLDNMDNETKEFTDAMRGSSGFINFPIGSVAVTTSREGISYEKETIENITTRLKLISREMCKAAIDEIKGHKYLWDRCLAFNKQIPVIKKAIIATLGTDNVLFNGANFPKFGGSMFYDVTTMPLSNNNIRITRIIKKTYHERKTYDKKWKLSRSDYSAYNGTALVPDSDATVVIKDTANKPVARLRAWLEERDNNAEIMFIQHSGDVSTTDISRTMVAHILHLDRANVKLLSEMEAPESTSSGGSTGRRPRAYEYNKGDSTNSADWKPIMDNIDDLDECIYVEQNRHSVQGSDTYRQLTRLFDAGKLTMPIIAVNAQTFARINDGKIGSQLITPDEAIKPFRAKVESMTAEYLRMVKISSVAHGIRNCKLYRTINNDDLRKRITLPIVTRVNRMLELANRIEDTLDSDGYDLNMIVDSQEVRKQADAIANQIGESLDKKYPMLSYMGYYMYDSHVEDAVNYIKLVNGA